MPAYGGGGVRSSSGALSYSPTMPIRSPIITGMNYGGAAESVSSGMHRCASAPAAPPVTPLCGEAEHTMPPPAPPAEGANAHLDGKDFFRQARLRLTYEQFNQFLTNIKRLNDHVQTRDETLKQAQDIFGPDNQDLFVAFNELLNKHGLT